MTRPASKPESTTEPEAKAVKAKDLQGPKTKHRVRRAMTWLAFAGLLFWLSQILDSHRLWHPALVCEFLGVLASARFLWISFINQSGKRQAATVLACIYVLLGWAVCGWLFWSEQNSANGQATARAGWQPPELPVRCEFISMVNAGGSGTERVGTKGAEILMLASAYQDTNGAYKMEKVVGAHISENRLFADVTIPGAFPFGPFKLSGNKINGRLPPTWEMNYDANAIEIVNDHLVPIYQIIYRRPDVIEIYGEFLSGNRVFAVAPHGMRVSRHFVDPSLLELKRIFKYPASAYPGKRVE